MMKAIWTSLILLCLAASAQAAQPRAQAPCRDLEFDGASYTVCTVQAGQDLRLFLRDPAGALIGTPERLAQSLPSGEHVVFAMNAGMYHPDRRPVGLFVEEGAQQHAIVTSAGPGNFGLLPNGVFCIGQGFSVIESRAYAADPPECRYATQSGPMLVIDGVLHPKFQTDGTSLNIRNGVGVSEDGRTAWFAISNEPVSLHQFARLFRDALRVPNALYLDGKVSRLVIPAQGREDLGLPMGPIVALLAPDASGAPAN